MAPPDKAACCVYLKSIQGGAIRTLFEVLKEVVHDVLLKFDSTGVRLLQMDSTKCALVGMKLRHLGQNPGMQGNHGGALQDLF